MSKAITYVQKSEVLICGNNCTTHDEFNRQSIRSNLLQEPIFTWLSFLSFLSYASSSLK